MKISFLWSSPQRMIFVGVVIRELFSWWTGLPYDMEVWIRNGYFVSNGLSPYHFFPPVPGLSFAYLHESIGSVGYLPLWSMVVAAMFRAYSVFGANRFFFYFLLKQPGVLGDVWLAYLLYRFVLRVGGTQSVALSAMRFWIFFPYAILISAVWGQFDALVAVTLFYFLLAHDSKGRSISLGLGIFLKLMPVVFVPYLFIRDRCGDWKAQLGALLIPASLTILVFLISNWTLAPLAGTLASQTLSLVPFGLTYLNWFGTSFAYPIFSRVDGFFLGLRLLWIPAVAAASFFAMKRFSSASVRDSVQAFLLVLIVFFLTRWGVNEQLLIYLLPLLLVDTLVWHPERRTLFHLTWVLGIIFLVANNDLLLLFMGPVSTESMNFALGLHAVENHTAAAALRYVTILVLGTLFSAHLFQVLSVLTNTSRCLTPWIFRPFVSLRTRLIGIRSDGGTDSTGRFP